MGITIPWEGDQPDHADAYPVIAVMWVRADSQDEAVQIAKDAIDGMANVDACERGHVRDGFVVTDDWLSPFNKILMALHGVRLRRKG